MYERQSQLQYLLVNGVLPFLPLILLATWVSRRFNRRASKLLAGHRDKVDEISQYLYERETITGQEFMDILNAAPQKGGKA